MLVISYGTKLWAKISIKKIESTYSVAKKRMFPNESLDIDLKVENLKLLPVWVQVQLANSLNKEVFVHETGLLGYSNYEDIWSIESTKRGVYEIGPFKISAGDLLGFHQSHRAFNSKQEVIVYPELLQLKSAVPFSKEFFGNNKSFEFIEDPILISGTREHGFQRSAKHIHWQATAKTLVLQEKIYEPSSHIKAFILIDVEGYKKNNAFEEFETMLKVVASYIVSLSRKKIAVGLMVNGKLIGDDVPFVKAAEDNGLTYRLLEKLARITPEYNDDFGSYIDYAKHLGNHSCLYFCYSLNKARHLKKFSRQPSEIFTSFNEDSSYNSKSYNINDLIFNQIEEE